MKISGIFSAFCVCAALCVGMSPAFAAESAEETVEIRTYTNAEALGDNDELFAGYVDTLFLGDESGFELFGNYGESHFEGIELDIYREMKSEVHSIAAGERESTSFTLSPISWVCTYEELGVEAYVDESGTVHVDKTEVGNAIWDKIQHVSYCVMMDCPYEMYWYDKTTGESFGWSTSHYTDESVTIVSLTITYYVEESYQATDENGVKSNTAVDASKVAVAQAAAENAKKLVEEYALATDLEKLSGYYEEIRALSTYNSEAAENEGIAYGDPWQLIYVFDGDPETTVVCEGYSKAFQYLCDMSDFEDVVCYTVIGYLSSAYTTEGHMWNVVTFGGVNSLCDLTNRVLLYDADDMVYSGSDGYYFIRNGSIYAYTYESKTVELYGEEILTLGKYADSVALSAEELELEIGETAVLEAVVTPDDATNANVTWTSSDESVATVENGVVTAISAGEAVIEAKTGTVSATCTVTVKASEPAITNVTIESTDEAIVVTIDFDNPTGGAVLAVGYGQDGEMVDMQSVSGSTAELSKKTQSVKVFLWDSLAGMVPLCASAAEQVE